MPGRVRLPRIKTGWPDLTDALARWADAIERGLSWSWGPGFDVGDGEHGHTVSLMLPAFGKVAKTGAAAIPAMAGGVPGVGEITLYALGGSGEPLQAGEPDLAYNIAPEAVTANQWVVVLKVDTEWLIIYEVCPVA